MTGSLSSFSSFGLRRSPVTGSVTAPGLKAPATSLSGEPLNDLHLGSTFGSFCSILLFDRGQQIWAAALERDRRTHHDGLHSGHRGLLNGHGVRLNGHGVHGLKAYLEDDTAELETTAWEATRCFTRMSLDRFVAREMRDEESTILARCIGRTWIFRLSRSENHRGIYARIEYAEPVSRKSLFLDRSPCREEAVAQSLPSSPVSTISAFGDGSSPVSSGTSTGAVDSRRDKGREPDNASREQFRRGFGSGFLSCTILVWIGMSKLVLFILALACFVVRKCH
ncbi:hypothetical protein R1sor_014497 [Riccia sorocarpa]|uniref:Transmembrane protein n=1 Tax=Riccia sorocarpa TaxID=122646 RepID=A0ABD3H9I9_9MARC